MNVVLIGYRGTGKTTIARKLSERLSMRVVNMDAEIVKRAGMTVPEIVERYGWDHFRDIESAVAAKFETEDNLVVDAGGGVIVRPRNIDSLKKNGIIFWLVADEETIVSRIMYDHQRPSLTGTKSFLEEVTEVLAERTPKYRAAADHVIDTAVMSVEEAVNTIVQIFADTKL
ncbi:shikimate kinase [Candidatus Poribacteria bacterium]|nr:shikimate kinase [Candidatus Poribacteria bacterium]